MINRQLTDTIFKKAKAAGWKVIITEACVTGAHQVVAQHKYGFEHNYEIMRLAVPNDLRYMQWLIRCADELEYTAVPVAGQDLTPKPFFTGLHY